MVDLKNQYVKIKPAIDTAIQECIDSTAFIKGPQVGAFEKALATYLDVQSVISCANGTDALQIAMMALDLKPGDEVIVPAFTYVATAEVIGLLGLTPVMIDVDPQTCNINRALVEEAITSKTKLVVPVHLFGQCADMEGILALTNAHNIAVIEDTAQAIGASYTFTDGTSCKAGTQSHFGTTSFFPSKNLGCFGDGGAIYTNDPVLAQKARMIANHGQPKKYVHEVIGINSRLDTLQAAILLEKLKHLDVYSMARQKAADFYDAAFKPIEAIEIPYRAANSTHVFHQYTIKIPAQSRDDFKNYLSQKGIPSMIYYPIPLNEQKAYQGLGRTVGNLSHTKALCQSVLSLPMHTELSVPQLEYITSTVQSYFS
ncbi:MAG: DegT/DnrJ/EryC1/StrS family aminotransferase [Cytophagia bacterium]|nr:MAG: DegT/DnrJ/EryC1/StrS family aminotransferase [Cytophagales bacterium]TAG35326.1 MAG: DegT/DnrJ/EryC1/StrS family aminotransferase [Cytophagia bacterium]TAG72963.1 MAG: DegT/DnrJ/EryC1/StrS family aminotransferase [Runella slithyformis]TAG77225.1 MAG: DegT/DnrJ/EryC1/StrS family aminotransferase [Cytophagales bacterium]